MQKTVTWAAPGEALVLIRSEPDHLPAASMGKDALPSEVLPRETETSARAGPVTPATGGQGVTDATAMVVPGRPAVGLSLNEAVDWAQAPEAHPTRTVARRARQRPIRRVMGKRYRGRGRRALVPGRVQRPGCAERARSATKNATVVAVPPGMHSEGNDAPWRRPVPMALRRD